MKKLLLLITGLLLLFSVEGQILRYSNYTAPTPPEEDTTNYYSVYKAIYDEFTTKPGHDTAHWQSDMVYSLDSLGIWGRSDLFYVFAQRSNAAGEAYINWITPGTFNLTDPGSTNPTFIVYQGLDGDGTSDYLSTNYIPSDDYVNITVNSTTLGVYMLDDLNSTSMYPVSAVVTSPSSTRLAIAPEYADGGTRGYVNDGTSLAGVLTSPSNGLHLATRRGATDKEVYHRGVSIGSASTASVGFPSVALYVCAANAVGTPGSFDSRRIALVILCDGVTDEEAGAINTIIERYMRRIGIGTE